MKRTDSDIRLKFLARNDDDGSPMRMAEGPQESHKRTCMSVIRENMFIVYSVGCACCFGMHNYMLSIAMAHWKNSIIILYPEFISLMVIPILYHIYRARYVVRQETGGLWWTKGRSMLFRGDGTFNSRPITVVFYRGITADLIPINIGLVTYFSKEVGFSPAVINSFNSLSAFTTAVLFYFLYKERLLFQHILGMVLIVASILIVAAGKSL